MYLYMQNNAIGAFLDMEHSDWSCFHYGTSVTCFIYCGLKIVYVNQRVKAIFHNAAFDSFNTLCFARHTGRLTWEFQHWLHLYIAFPRRETLQLRGRNPWQWHLHPSWLYICLSGRLFHKEKWEWHGKYEANCWLCCMFWCVSGKRSSVWSSGNPEEIRDKVVLLCQQTAGCNAASGWPVFCAFSTAASGLCNEGCGFSTSAWCGGHSDMQGNPGRSC